MVCEYLNVPADFADKRRLSATICGICGNLARICDICGNGDNYESMKENDISYKIRGCIYKVYNALGPGLLESVYVAALAHELVGVGMKVRCQVPLPVVYADVRLELGFRLDLLVDNLVLIEVKSIENLAEVHHKQVITYLKLSNLKLGILVNFNTDQLNSNIIRKVNGLKG